MRLRNWIEQAIGKQWFDQPVKVGKKAGRQVYMIHWIDGTEGDYYIDFDNHTIEVAC